MEGDERREDIRERARPQYGPRMGHPGAPQPTEEPPHQQGMRGHPTSASQQAYEGSVGRGTGSASSGRSGDSMMRGGGGSIRERRIPHAELLDTRPKTLVSKTGVDGTAMKLQANYFKLLTTTDWCLYKYRVDFAPEEDRTVVRKGMLKLHKSTLGAYIFDGTVLYTSNRLPQPLELCSARKSDDVRITITIRLVDDMIKGDENYLQFFNIIMRKCLENLQLQLVGRNYFDARNKAEVREYKLELWPGYDTSIRQHERNILMRVEITHKVMRQDTLLDILNDCYNQHGQEYQTRFSSQVIGLTVLTDYNNNTYRIDDVDYSVSPLSTFKRKGQDVTYKNYYLDKYQINIRNPKQPLLLSKSKSRDRRAGLAELVYLVPELCRATGCTLRYRGLKYPKVPCSVRFVFSDCFERTSFPSVRVDSTVPDLCPSPVRMRSTDSLVPRAVAALFKFPRDYCVPRDAINRCCACALAVGKNQRLSTLFALAPKEIDITG